MLFLGSIPKETLLAFFDRGLYELSSTLFQIVSYLRRLLHSPVLGSDRYCASEWFYFPHSEVRPMLQKQNVPCPNCGQNAIRTEKIDSYVEDRCRTGHILSVECPTCDYLMVSCALTREVIESYAPSFEMSHWKLSSPPKTILPVG